jgi:DNA invertase Pin-like site-specific DNA recombinase
MDKGKRKGRQRPRNGSGCTAVYMRVSSAKQAEHNSVAGQRHQISDWLLRHRMTWDDVRVYTDEAFSGRTTDRPSWQKLQADIAAGRVVRVVLPNLARAGRNVPEISRWVQDMAQSDAPEVVFITEGINLKTSVGRAIANIMATIAELEADLKSESISHGIRAKVAAGIPWGAQRVPVGSEGGPKLTSKAYDKLYARWRDGEKQEALAKEAGVSVGTLSRQFKRRG